MQYTHNGILFRLKEILNLKELMLNGNKPLRKINTAWSHLYVTLESELIGTEWDGSYQGMLGGGTERYGSTSTTLL